MALLAGAQGPASAVGVARLDTAFDPLPGGTVPDVLLRALGADATHPPRRSEMANHTAMLAADLRDPHLRRATHAHFSRVRPGTETLLGDPVRTGGHHHVDDLASLATTLEATCHGALVVWAVAEQGSLEDALHAAIGAALRPFSPDRAAAPQPA